MRFQFEPIGMHTLDELKAAKAVREHGGTHIRICAPMMPSPDGKRPWRGVNQPLTVAFTAPSESVAKAVAKAYGEDLTSVWIRPA